MITSLAHTWFLTVRLLRQAFRQPWWIAVTLVQPFLWLVLYGQLFQNVIQIPGFGSTSYVTFLTPGIVIMSGLYSAGWSGMGVMDDLERSVIDRFLVTTASRFAIVSGRLLNVAIVCLGQSLLVIALGFLLGASYPGHVAGILMLLLAALLLIFPVGALSASLALTIRRRESVVAASNFVLVPLVFLSPVFIASSVMPHWIQLVSHFSPVTWAVDIARLALQQTTVDWLALFMHLTPLIGFNAVCAVSAIVSFRRYQRSL